MTDFDIKQSDECDNRNETQRSQSERGVVDGSLHSEIEALIPRLTRYARALTRDGVDADDLVQESLGRALGKIHKWEEGTDLRAWLFTILHNQYVSRVRREARERAGIELQKRSPRLTPVQQQITRLELRDLRRAIAKLSEEQRSVILFVGLEGMRYDQAAAVLNLPVGTVRSRVARGRETLRILTGQFPSRHSRRPRSAANPDCLSWARSDLAMNGSGSRGGISLEISGGLPMKSLSLAVSAVAILTWLASSPVAAQQRAMEPPPQLHAVNPSLSLSAPTTSPIQEQMREDYAASLKGAQRELLQQNPSGLGRQELAIGRELNSYTGPQ